jgi:glycosyltransferase involved in cell wall biosynthesis
MSHKEIDLKKFDQLLQDLNLKIYCDQISFSDNNEILLTANDLRLKLNIISEKYDIKIIYENKIINEHKRGIISHILYGISENESIDVTIPVMGFLKVKNMIKLNDDINIISECDPYKNTPKRLYIYFDHSETPCIIDEFSGNLQSNLILLDYYLIDILIYVIYFDDNTYRMVEKYKNYNYIKLINNAPTKYFESSIFKYMLINKQEWVDKDYVGIVAYSPERKIGKKIEEIYDILIKMIAKNNCDLITFFDAQISLDKSFHGKLKEIYDYTLSILGLTCPIDYSLIPLFYSNYWMTTPDWMLKYIDFVLNYIAQLENKNDLFLQELVNSDAGYHAGQLTSDQLLKMTEFPYYTNHSFVVERLPCIFFWKNNFYKTLHTPLSMCNIQGYKSHQKKMKIYLLSHDMSYTGAPIYICRLQNYLKKSGFDTKLLCCSGGALADVYPSIQTTQKEMLGMILLECLDWKLYITMHALSLNTQDEVIDQIINSDFSMDHLLVYHTNFSVICNTLVTADYVNSLSRLKMPVYWVIHECQRESYFNYIGADIMYSAFKLATSIIYTCSTVQTQYCDIPQKSLIISDGLDLEEMQKKYDQDLTVRKTFGISEQDTVLCIVGVICIRKRQRDFIVNVFSKLLINFPNLKLILVGPNFLHEKEGYDDFEQNIFPKYKNSIFCTGEVRNTIPYVKESDILICYSEFECFPISNLESMFCQKPIVSTNVFGISEQLTNQYDGFLFDVADQNDTCYKLLTQLIIDRKLCHELGSNAKKTLLEKFNSRITLKKYNELLTSHKL